MRRALVISALFTGLWLAAPAHAAGNLRLLFNSDWSGTSEVYAAAPTGGSPIAQVTPAPATCVPGNCHYGYLDFRDAVPSPNGRFILYTEWQSCDSLNLEPRLGHPPAVQATLFVAHADGTRARVLARSRGLTACPRGFSASWAADSKRIAYVGYDRLHDIYEVHTVDLDGRHNRVIGAGDRVSWSPDGTSIAFSGVSVRKAGRTRVVAAGYGFWWSPDGRWLAYCTSDVTPGGYCGTAGIVRADGSKQRTILVNAADPPEWSGDSRFLSIWTPDGVIIVDVATGATHVLSLSVGDNDATAWQHHGHVLSVTGIDGTHLVDAATGTTRLLTADRAGPGATWSPDGSYLAYTTSSDGDLHVVTPAGETRTLVSGSGAYGGGEGNLVWTHTPRNANYRLPQPRVLAAVSSDGLTAPWPITRLAADGDSVAYISCDHLFVWTPATQAVVQAEPSSSLNPLCLSSSFSAEFRFYTFALSGDRIADGWAFGITGISCGLEGERIDDAASYFDNIEYGGFCGYGPYDQGFGDLTGGAGLLVSSSWQRPLTYLGPPSEQDIRRLDYRAGTGWSSTVIATAPGPLVPLDVDGGRIVAGGENATVLYDASGKQLLSVPVSPLAAQLSGSDLIILVRGQLFVYDAGTGARLHTWPLPDVPSGAECGSVYGGWECRGTQLVLEDAARGLAAYLFEGQVHVVQLTSGTDMTIGKGTAARFVNEGLVYADGADLHLVTFDKLPSD